MIPCPICGKITEPYKPQETLTLWKIECCGLSVVDPCFMDVLIKWRDLVTMYERVKP